MRPYAVDLSVVEESNNATLLAAADGGDSKLMCLHACLRMRGDEMSDVKRCNAFVVEVVYYAN